MTTTDKTKAQNPEEKAPSEETMRLADKYTYRVTWDENKLFYTVTCDEINFGYTQKLSNVEELLAATKLGAANLIYDCLIHGKSPSSPLHPGEAQQLTQQSLEGAWEASLRPVIPFEKANSTFFTREEIHVLVTRLHWDCFDYRATNIRKTVDALYDAYRALTAVLINVAAKQRDSGNSKAATATDQIRFHVDEDFLKLDFRDRSAIESMIIDYLHRYVAYSCILYEDEPHLHSGMSPDERMQAITEKPTLPVIRDLFSSSHRSWTKLRRVLHRSWPWADQLTEIPDGWAARFGAELLEDMQHLIDLGLTDFGLDQVKEKWGVLRIYFDDDYFDNKGEYRSKQRIELADLMHVLLSIYGDLSYRTCIKCGTWKDVRITGGWTTPLCNRCLPLYRQRYTANMLPKRDEKEWQTMTEPTDGIEQREQEHRPELSDPRMAGLHIHRLLKECDIEKGIDES